MKVTLLFLAVFVAVSHQQYNYRNYRMFGYPWFIMPFPQQRDAFSNEFDSLNQDEHQEEGGTAMGLIGSNSRNNIALLFDEEEEFRDTQSRIKGINSYRTRPYYSNNDQKARFFFNLPNNGVSNTFNNPLFKTAFFTSTITLSLNSVQNCVPTSEAIGKVLPACRRKRQFNHTTFNDEQFAIAPSETLKMMPTVFSSPQLSNSESIISSSKDDSVSPDDRSTLDDLREKRFFINKNQFVVTSYSTSFVFVNATITKTVNFLSGKALVPLANGFCDPGANNCVNCLPPGFIVCPPPTG